MKRLQTALSGHICLPWVPQTLISALKSFQMQLLHIFVHIFPMSGRRPTTTSSYEQPSSEMDISWPFSINTLKKTFKTHYQATQKRNLSDLISQSKVNRADRHASNLRFCVHFTIFMCLCVVNINDMCVYDPFFGLVNQQQLLWRH